VPIKCPSKDKVAFQITIGRVIDQMMILKITSFFYGRLMNTQYTCRITPTTLHLLGGFHWVVSLNYPFVVLRSIIQYSW
jgi:hypothetical protein